VFFLSLIARKRQANDLNITFAEGEEEDITKEENYLLNIGQSNKEIKIVEDAFRVKFLNRKPGFHLIFLL
jgi:hypothetical protein